MFNMSVYQLSICLICLVILPGCGQGTDFWKSRRPSTTVAKGIVTYRGNPLPKAMIIFQPTDTTAVAASATTNAAGEFELRSFPPAAGAVPGNYQVMIFKTDYDDPKYDVMPVNNNDPDYMKETADPQPVSLIPVRYNDPKLSGLTAQIPTDGTTALRFDLVD